MQHWNPGEFPLLRSQNWTKYSQPFFIPCYIMGIKRRNNQQLWKSKYPVEEWTAEKVRQWRRVWERVEEWDGGNRQNKYSISTNAPCCIAITLLNCTAHIEILILPLVLLAAKADVCARDLCSGKSCFCEAKHADHKRWIHFVFYSSGETCIE